MRGAQAGTVYLVGAGPGDPELLTTRGAELLGTADAVLHDELVHPVLLARARHGARIEHVGKRGSDPALKQHAQALIDARLVELARAGQSVVRLKGGDPYLFGRGSEEAEALAAAGVPFEVVPGVCTPLAVAAYAGFSLTHRDFASSVTFLSGTTRAGEAFDFSEVAGLRGTLCVFMGVKRLEAICAALVATARRDPTTPAVVVERASLARQRTVEGTLADISALARAAGIEAPAMLVVGEVVTLRKRLRWFDALPLFGKRVLVARAAHQSGGSSALLRSRGAEPVEIPLLTIVDPPDPEPLRDAARRLHAYDVIAFTSENGVTKLFAALDRDSLDARAFGAAKVAAIGPGTARALEARGIRADVVPSRFQGEPLAEDVLGLLRSVRGTVAGARVLIPRARVAREILPDMLREAGVVVDVVAAYENQAPDAEQTQRLVERFDREEIDVVLLTSSSTATALAAALGADAASRLGRVMVASIGAVTTATAQSLGVRVDVTATESTIEGLVAALEAHTRGTPLTQ